MCTVARPPVNGSAALEPSPENNLARLISTEKQFRQASILASLDVEKHELFTFYRKVDVVKDQKTILNKFGYVLRSNSCIISYKAAARVPELFKADNARLYRLFVTAVLSSINLRSSSEIVRVGPRAYMVSHQKSTAEEQFLAVETGPSSWTVRRIDLQLLVSGQLILTMACDNYHKFVLLSDYAQQSYAQFSDVDLVYLAPLGHLARYDHGWCGHLTLDFTDELDEQHDVMVRRKLWASTVSHWLEVTSPELLGTQSTDWVELEVPVKQEIFDASGNQSVQHELVWRKILWPTSLTYSITGDQRSEDHEENESVPEDPLQFVQDWILSATDRITTTANVGQDSDELYDSQNNDDGQLFSDEAHFDEPGQYPTFNQPTFPASQAVYPTPPDAILTHHTPAMSSVDGLAPTPAQASRSAGELLAQLGGHDIRNVSGLHAAPVGSGLYDEDLFEEMPDDHNFGQHVDGEEPNWDFFDQPDYEMQDVIEGKASNRSPMSTAAGLSTMQDTYIVAQEQDREELPQSAKASAANEVDAEADVAPVKDGTENSSSAGGSSVRENSDEQVTHHRSTHEAVPFGKERTMAHVNLSAQGQEGRGSSLYDGTSWTPPKPLHDDRYSTLGKFFFDASGRKHLRNSYTGISERFVPSLGRDDGFSSDEVSSIAENGDIEKPFSPTVEDKPFWMQYGPELPQQEVSPSPVIDTDAIEAEVSSLFDLMKLDITNEHLTSRVGLLEWGKPCSPTSDPEDASTVAQIFVDAVSQTSFLGTLWESFQTGPSSSRAIEMTIDIGGTNSGITCSSVAQVLTLKTLPPNTRARGRITKLDQPRILARRAERSLSVYPSIIPFWDTLGLQPKNGAKDVTAICLHPAGSGVAHGCRSFLSRMGDAYTSCNFGLHETGRLPSIANDGLVACASKQAPREPGLLRVCQRLGAALAASTYTGHNLVVYMISKDTTSLSYFNVCNAFYVLFKAFVEGSPAKATMPEIALQIVPMSFVAASETLVVPTQARYLEVAMEVYNRLPAGQIKDQPGASALAVTLDTSNPKDLSFDLSASITSPWSKHGTALHVAYAWTVDRRWLVAAWTDQHGEIAWTMSYSLYGSGSGRRRARSDVIQDIWEVSQDIMHKQRGKWRLVVAQHGLFEIEEAQEWMKIANTTHPDKKPVCSLLLLSVDLRPAFAIMLPTYAKNSQSGAMPTAHATWGTPTSTPQATTTSPDQLVPATPTPGGSSAVNAPTPPDNAFDPSTDMDLTLYDPEEESWIVILPFGHNLSDSILEIKPALASGYLVKRSGTKDETEVAMFGVSLFATTQAASTLPLHVRDEWLEDILEQYRRLATLAAIRGCIDRTKEIVPWHVATVIKAAKHLGKVMRTT